VKRTASKVELTRRTTSTWSNKIFNRSFPGCQKWNYPHKSPTAKGRDRGMLFWGRRASLSTDWGISKDTCRRQARSSRIV